MIIKPLTKPQKLILLEYLHTRMDLSNEDEQYLVNLRKGYEGEVAFNSLTEKLTCNCLVFNGLLLEFNNTKFQIDSLIALENEFYLIEVKNFEGDFYYKNGLFYSMNGKERKDPLVQLERCSSLFRQLLQSLGFSRLRLEPSVVHVNPEFTLYQASPEAPIIFPSQVHRYLTKINKISSTLNRKHEMLAGKFLSRHIEEDPYAQLPPYTYSELRKGLICANCHSFLTNVSVKFCVCGKCGHKETVESAVLRGVEELKLLFPDVRITSKLVFDWCGVVGSQKTIKRILERHFQQAGGRRWTYFE
ncbi:nuclease-related domain-containing protein [Bacillus rubiinfantis]|uniref:nuclease-related domain-containing protein n=1 Tax=Bacillus rubiinfantis TaxID=1499680 RepID=UPI0009E27EE1|nr:nuclease-related domain-containing protein [Bacillus rubiinfantis]